MTERGKNMLRKEMRRGRMDRKREARESNNGKRDNRSVSGGGQTSIFQKVRVSLLAKPLAVGKVAPFKRSKFDPHQKHSYTHFYTVRGSKTKVDF